VRASEIHALVGLNGAGKTSLLRSVLGMLTPEEGAVRVFGQSPGSMDADRWKEVGHMLEVPFAYPELTVRENVYASCRLHGLDRATAREASTRALRRWGVEALSGRRVHALSSGNRQRTGLAAALAHDPGLIILDEPSNTLDPRGTVTLRETLHAARARGAAVLVSSHHLDEVSRVADVITVLHAGRVVGWLDPAASDLERQFFELVLAADQESGTNE
jgi:ABC-2 type transport system ATP-binding protein